MADLSSIRLGSTTYSIKDKTARNTANGRAQVVNLLNYTSQGSVLPTFSAVFTRDNKPVHFRMFDVNTAVDVLSSGTQYVAFCYEHGEWNTDPNDLGWKYLIYKAADRSFVKEYTKATVPAVVLRAFGENVASQTHDGRMSAKDKRKLDGLKEPVILTVGGDGAEDYKAFNTAENCEKIGSALTAGNPNVYVRWEDTDGVFLSPVSINTDCGETLVTVWGCPYLMSGDSRNVVGVEYYCSELPSASALFESYRLITATRGGSVSL